jgi:hypothetical protein
MTIQRIGIILNGSPLFTGGAGSGESEIRRHILESDLLEAIVALPTDMFYNTGIGTYVWIVTNRKELRRKGKIHLIDARERWQPPTGATCARTWRLSSWRTEGSGELAQPASHGSDRSRAAPSEATYESALTLRE